MLQPFHLAVPVSDLNSTREFYGKFLGFEEGRSNEHWIDWNFFGHQFVTHLRPQKSDVIVNHVDGHGVPVPHFGVVLEWQQWHDFAEKLRAAKIKFVIEPYIRFKGKTGEQATMFFKIPAAMPLNSRLSKIFLSFLQNKYS